MWHFATDRINWQPGTKGKGYILDDGSVVEWTTDGNGDPHHKEAWDQTGSTSGMAFLYYINPDGGITDGGLDYRNTTGKSDEECIAYISSADPRTHDGSDQEQQFDDDLVESIYGDNPQSEFESRDEGFGHAHNVMDVLGATQDSLQELREWLDSFDGENETSPPSLHHTDVLDMMPKPAVSPSNAPAISPPGHESEFEKLMQKGAGEWGRDDGWNPTPSWWDNIPESWTQIDPWTSNEPAWEGKPVLPAQRCPQCAGKNHTPATPYTCKDCGHVWMDRIEAKTATHDLQWMPGRMGKGILTPSNQMITWPIDQEGNPHHMHMLPKIGMDPTHDNVVSAFKDHTLFLINPNGLVQDSWLGDSQLADQNRLRMINAIDPALRPPRRTEDFWTSAVDMPDPPKEIWPDLYGDDQPRCSLCGGQTDKPGPCPTCTSMLNGSKTGNSHEWISNYTNL